jgi:enamine deaminase RidA (YjgF/YER057c/UK114 family)
VERTDINPWEWSKGFGFSQAVELRAADRLLFVSGQTAIGADGSPPTTSDMAEQVRLAFENLGTVLAAAGMTIADVVKLTVYTTDVDALFAEYGTATQALGSNLPAMTLIGVTRLAFPELKVEIEAVAAKS